MQTVQIAVLPCRPTYRVASQLTAGGAWDEMDPRALHDRGPRAKSIDTVAFREKVPCTSRDTGTCIPTLLDVACIHRQRAATSECVRLTTVSLRVEALRTTARFERPASFAHLASTTPDRRSCVRCEQSSG